MQSKSILDTVKLPYRIVRGTSFEHMSNTVEQLYIAFFNRYESFPTKIVMPRESFEVLRTTRLRAPSGKWTSLTALTWLTGATQASFEAEDVMDSKLLAIGSNGLMLFAEMPQS